jgi:short-subunit dehydrogenase
MPVAVVTGASAGVGRATAIRLAQAGYDVGLLARGRAGLAATAKDVEAAGQRPIELPADVAEWDAVDGAATQVEDELGPIDVWVNNAMTTVFGAVADVTAAEIRRTTEVTYLGQVHGTLAALERMRPRDRGRIVNVGSSLAFVGIPLQAAYCGAKFAVRGFTESVRAELLAAGSGVTVSQVHLPALNTPQFGWCESKMDRRATPVPPIYDVDVAAAAVLRAVGDGRRADVIGSWNTALVAVAQRFPGLVAHYAARTAVDSQQTDEPEQADRPSNLWAPVDDDHDEGAAGDARDTAGVRSPSFVATLPKQAVDLARSGVDEVAELARLLLRRVG